jgi:nucleotide-binding universal stress UspA family protein
VYKKLLIATDGSELAGKAVYHGLRLAKQLNAEAAIIRVTPQLAVYVAEWGHIPAPQEIREQVAHSVREHLQAVSRIAGEIGVASETLHVEDDRAWHAIIEAARGKGCDLIVMASHGRGAVSAAFLGSETQKVLSHSSIPVLVVR